MGIPRTNAISGWQGCTWSTALSVARDYGRTPVGHVGVAVIAQDVDDMLPLGRTDKDVANTHVNRRDIRGEKGSQSFALLFIQLVRCVFRFFSNYRFQERSTYGEAGFL